MQSKCRIVLLKECISKIISYVAVVVFYLVLASVFTEYVPYPCDVFIQYGGTLLVVLMSVILACSDVKYSITKYKQSNS